MKWIKRKPSPGGAPFWGVLASKPKQPLFSDYASNALTLGPAGSRKTIATVITNILSIKSSKFCPDFKGEEACICIPPLLERGETLRVLNPFGLWPEQIEQRDQYNSMDIIVDDLYRPGGLRDVFDDLREKTKQLLKDPPNGKGDESYWLEGSRKLKGWCILLEAMIDEYDATLSAVSLLIEDRQRLEDNLRFVLGIDLEGKALPQGPMPIETTPWAGLHSEEDLAEFVKTFRAQARSILSMMENNGKAFESFITQAQQALAPFAFGRPSTVMGRSTFKMSDFKEGDNAVTLFVMLDASRPATSDAYLGLMQWCFLTAMKRHPAKHVPVYNILDEATNYTVHGLVELLTWGRGHGIKNHIIIQDFTAFEKRYGRDSLETLLSETEVKQFLPGQRSPKTLSMIVKMLGEQSVMSASLSKPDKYKALNETMSEAARPLMTEDELRRTPYGLLIIRKKPPALITPVSYAEIDPWRRQAGINPFHGKAFLKPVKLKLKQ